MKTIISLLLLFSCFFVNAQVINKTPVTNSCLFDIYKSKGGHWVFKLYYDDYFQTPKNGECKSYIAGQLYEDRLFKNGVLMKANLYYGPKRELTYVFERFLLTPSAKQGDTIIAISKTLSVTGKKENEEIYFYAKDGRKKRYVKNYYQNGELRQFYRESFCKAEEIKGRQYTSNPDSYDAEGYYVSPAQDGWQEEYYENGKLSHKYFMRFDPMMADYSNYLMTGPYEKYYQSGKLKEKGKNIESHPDGTIVSYSEEGKILETRHYERGFEVGNWTAYYPNGQKRYDITYNNYKIVKGVWYFENGKKEKIQEMDASWKGWRKTWYENGNQKSEEELSYGEIASMGLRKYWYEDGTLKQVLDGRINKSDTTVREFFASGRKKRIQIERREGSKLTSIHTSWNEKGIEVSHSITKQGGKDGTYQFFHENYEDGTAKREWLLDNKDSSTTYKLWFSNGQLHKQAKCKNHTLLNGLYSEWDSTGVLRRKGNYRAGVRDGEYSEWNEKAELIFSNNYKNGKPLQLPFRKNSISSSQNCEPIKYAITACDSIDFLLRGVAMRHLSEKSYTDTSFRNLKLYFTGKDVDSIKKVLVVAWNEVNTTNNTVFDPARLFSSDRNAITYTIDANINPWIRMKNWKESPQWDSIRNILLKYEFPIPDTLNPASYYGAHYMISLPTPGKTWNYAAIQHLKLNTQLKGFTITPEGMMHDVYENSPYINLSRMGSVWQFNCGYTGSFTYPKLALLDNLNTIIIYDDGSTEYPFQY